MIKILKKIRWFIRILLTKFIGLVFAIFFPRNKKYILFVGRHHLTVEQFMHNTKYLYLYLNHINNYGLKTIWLCDDEKLRQDLLNIGYKNIYLRKSFLGRYYSLKSKYAVTDYLATDIMEFPFMLEGATVIDLWHGIPLKKIIYDEVRNKIDMTKIKNKIWNFMRQKEDYFVVNCDFEQNCYTTAFIQPKENIKIIGSPRLDVLLHDVPKAEIFMEEEFENIKKLKEQGKKVFIYMPTFRDTGKDISGWLKSDKLKLFLKNNNAVLVCKLHPNDDNSLSSDLTEEFYSMNNNSDIYPVLKYSDALITDYSSVYYDYLLLDKPILYYPIDLEEYESTRGFYAPYEELTAGIKAYNEDELINAMQEVINGVDNYKEQRKALRDRMFKYQDGHNCERVVKWIKSLN